MKKKVKAEDLCSSFKSVHLYTYFKEALSYSFEEQPYYSKLKHFFTSELLSRNTIPNENIFHDARKKLVPITGFDYKSTLLKKDGRSKEQKIESIAGSECPIPSEF